MLAHTLTYQYLHTSIYHWWVFVVILLVFIKRSGEILLTKKAENKGIFIINY